MPMNNSSILNQLNKSSICANCPSTETTLFVVAYALLSLLVITGNILVIMSYASNPKLRKGITVFFVSLAISDLCVSLVPLPYWISVQLYPAMLSFNRFFAPLDVFSAFASIFNLVAISVERRVVVSIPRLTQRRGWLKKLNMTMICVAWFMALLISLCYGFFINDTITRTLLVFLVGFVVPLVVMVVLYVDIYRLVRHTQERFTRQDSNVKQRGSRYCNAYEETAKTVIIVTTLFVIAWTPFFVCSLLSTFALTSLPSDESLARLINFVKVMHYSNSAVNPLVYAYRNEIMRKTMISIFHKFVNYICCVTAPKRQELLI